MLEPWIFFSAPCSSLFSFGAFYCIYFIRMKNIKELVENRIAEYLKLRLITRKLGKHLVAFVCFSILSLKWEVLITRETDFVSNFSNSKLKINLIRAVSHFTGNFSASHCSMSLVSFLFNVLGEEKKCMGFCSIRIYLERNKQTSKWGNYYLSISLRNKGTYSMHVTVIGFVWGDFFYYYYFLLLASLWWDWLLVS